MTAAREGADLAGVAGSGIGGGGGGNVGPIVLCEDGRDGTARLFVEPVAVVRAHRVEEVLPACARIERGVADGLHAAGFLGYEAGYALEPRLAALAPARRTGLPLVWFGLFDRCETIAGDALGARLPGAAGAWAQVPVPETTRAAYEGDVAAVLELIAAGEVYQANLSFRAAVRYAGDPAALYAGLRARSRAGWGGMAFTGEHWLLSASPELFFALDGDRLSARPMKGTARRGADPATDRAAAAGLAADPKARAENLMIVDLTRNDLSRVSVAGSVTVPELFGIETYPTVHQMISSVEAQVTPGLGAVDVLRAMFPCGSITGAPKIRAMQAIAELEPRPRGAYTGSMGWIAPDGDAAFNVLIRTLTVMSEGRAELGLGAGIVADSVAADEWAECLAKGAFVADGQRRFDLVETMRFEPDVGIVDLEAHLARLSASAAALGFAFDAHGARNALQAASFRMGEAARVRLRLARGGALAVMVGALPATPAEPVAVAVRPHPVVAGDFRLRHKTSDRGFWEAARDPGAFETLFTDAAGYLTEGSFTSLFVAEGHTMVTPPLARGLLPGVLRGRLIVEGRAREGELRVADLRGGFWVGNAVRGLVRARLG